MTYDEIIEIIKKRNIRKVLIFGAPRSGTTLASFVFAKELGLELIPEEIADKMSEKCAISTIISREIVFHSNGAILYFYKIKDPAVIKIKVDRCMEATLLSAKRVEILQHLNYSYKQFGKGGNYIEKYNIFWEHYKDDASYLLDYESLKSTKYWLSKKERKNFAIKQVTKSNISVLSEFGRKYLENVGEEIYRWNLEVGKKRGNHAK